MFLFVISTNGRACIHNWSPSPLLGNRRVKAQYHARPNDDWRKRTASQGETASVRDCSLQTSVRGGLIDISIQSPATTRGYKSCRSTTVHTGAYGKVISSKLLLKLVDRVRTSVAYVYRYSKLPFRALVREYGVDLCYTPMVRYPTFTPLDVFFGKYDS